MCMCVCVTTCYYVYKNIIWLYTLYSASDKMSVTYNVYDVMFSIEALVRI